MNQRPKIPTATSLNWKICCEITSMSSDEALRIGYYLLASVMHEATMGHFYFFVLPEEYRDTSIRTEDSCITFRNPAYELAQTGKRINELVTEDESAIWYRDAMRRIAPSLSQQPEAVLDEYARDALVEIIERSIHHYCLLSIDGHSGFRRIACKALATHFPAFKPKLTVEDMPKEITPS